MKIKSSLSIHPDRHSNENNHCRKKLYGIQLDIDKNIWVLQRIERVPSHLIRIDPKTGKN
ncbi:MAG: hypothetical protein ABI045_06350 [Flavobacteriales bacterium]